MPFAASTSAPSGLPTGTTMVLKIAPWSSTSLIAIEPVALRLPPETPTSSVTTATLGVPIVAVSFAP